MANKDAHLSVSEYISRNKLSYCSCLELFHFSAVVETSPMMPADYREEVSHLLGGAAGWGEGEYNYKYYYGVQTW